MFICACVECHHLRSEREAQGPQMTLQGRKKNFPEEIHVDYYH